MSVANYGYISPYADAVEVVNGVAVVKGDLQIQASTLQSARLFLLSPGPVQASGTSIVSVPAVGCEMTYYGAGPGGGLALNVLDASLASPTQSTILSVQNAGVLISGSGRLSISTLTVSTINGAPTVSELFNRFYQANPALSTISFT